MTLFLAVLSSLTGRQFRSYAGTSFRVASPSETPHAWPLQVSPAVEAVLMGHAVGAAFLRRISPDSPFVMSISPATIARQDLAEASK
jgi:hypothetical protein